MVSESRPNKGWKLVEVNRNAVDSHDALLELWKYDVMTGWEDTMMVPSKQATNWAVNKPPKMSQNLERLTPARNGDAGSPSRSLLMDTCVRVLPKLLA